jgi:hypothetical protein
VLAIGKDCEKWYLRAYYWKHAKFNPPDLMI